MPAQQKYMFLNDSIDMRCPEWFWEPLQLCSSNAKPDPLYFMLIVNTGLASAGTRSVNNLKSFTLLGNNHCRNSHAENDHRGTQGDPNWLKKRSFQKLGFLIGSFLKGT